MNKFFKKVLFLYFPFSMALGVGAMAINPAWYEESLCSAFSQISLQNEGASDQGEGPSDGPDLRTKKLDQIMHMCSAVDGALVSVTDGEFSAKVVNFLAGLMVEPLQHQAVALADDEYADFCCDERKISLSELIWRIEKMTVSGGRNVVLVTLMNLEKISKQHLKKHQDVRLTTCNIRMFFLISYWLAHGTMDDVGFTHKNWIKIFSRSILPRELHGRDFFESEKILRMQRKVLELHDYQPLPLHSHEAFVSFIMNFMETIPSKIDEQALKGVGEQ